MERQPAVGLDLVVSAWRQAIRGCGIRDLTRSGIFPEMEGNIWS